MGWLWEREMIEGEEGGACAPLCVCVCVCACVCGEEGAEVEVKGG